ncbi:MAG: adenylyl-sulfate kinase [Planctomycetia bacterium]|nr:adenylyl-sulfate kinase [Planctomycetia bacterium]
MADETVVVRWHPQAVTRQEREGQAGHRGGVVWFTGLSGCGKSTLANLVDRRLYARGIRSFVLDGDNVRHGLNAAPALLRDRYGAALAERFGLGFGADDRAENIRRIGAVAELFTQAGILVLTAFVSPYRRDRDAVRALLPAGDFVEVFVRAPLDVCEARDPKGLYRRARAGELKGFTGIDDPYEEPLAPELVVDSATRPAPDLADEMVRWLERAGTIPPAPST